MKTIKVVNIKCGGCEKGIEDALSKKGLQNVTVDVSKQEVNFEGDFDLAKATLEKLGYPEHTAKKAKSVLKKAKSYETCAVGTVSEGLANNDKRNRKFWLLISLPIVILFLIIWLLLR